MADNGNSSSIVAIVAIVVIIAVGFLLYRTYGGTANNGGADNSPTIDVNLGTNGQ